MVVCRVLFTKNDTDTRTKRLKNALKNILHISYTNPMLHSKNRRFPPDTQHYDNIQKKLDFWDFLIYYSVRYSGIVQSVEQRTVNPFDLIFPELDLDVNSPKFRDLFLVSDFTVFA